MMWLVAVACGWEEVLLRVLHICTTDCASSVMVCWCLPICSLDRCFHCWYICVLYASCEQNLLFTICAIDCAALVCPEIQYNVQQAGSVLRCKMNLPFCVFDTFLCYCNIWVMWCWHGYLSGAKCKWPAYDLTDTNATHHLCFSNIQNGLSFWYRLIRIVSDKRP